MFGAYASSRCKSSPAASAELASERARNCSGSPLRASSAKAREEQVAGCDRSRAASPCGNRRAPTAELGAIDQVVVDERRRVNQLHRDGGPYEALLASGILSGTTRGLRGEHH